MKKVTLIRYLAEQGLPQKAIRVITQEKQSYISKVINRSIRPKEEAAPDFSKNEAKRYDILFSLYNLVKLPTYGIELEDKRYIHLLSALMVSEDSIRLMYGISKTLLKKILADKSINFKDLDSELLGIAKEDYLDLVSVL